MLYHIVFLVVVTQAMNIQPIQPRPKGHESDTILDKMRLELTSPNGSCSFPPQDVLENYSSESFKFLENCNKFILPSSKDKDTLLCMALFDVGLRICKANDSHTFKILTQHIPESAVDFQKLLTVVSKQHSDDLCTALKDAVVKPQLSLTQQWNLKEVMDKSNDTCSRLCFDYMGNANVFCQLILWGNQMIARTTSENQALSSPDNNKATGSDSMITGSQQDRSSPTGVEQLLSQPVVGLDTDQREGIPKANSRPNARKLTSDYMPNSTINKHIGQPEHAAELSHNTGTGYDALKDAASRPVNSGLVVNGDTSADLPVEKIESGYKGRHAQKLSTTNMDSTFLGNARQSKPTKAASPGSESSVGKPESDHQATGQSQEDRPNTEKVNAEFNTQIVTKPLSTKSVLMSASKVATVSSASAVDAVPQGVPSPNEADIERQELGGPAEEPFENEEQSFPSVDDDLNIPPGNNDLNFEEPVKSETLGNENYAKDPQEEMNNGNVYVRDRFEDSEDSHFFSYFFFLTGVFIIGYLVFHNKQKILALALEGRGRRGSRRRPNTANYHKLDSNLEEAVSSPCSTSSTHVIY